MRKTYRTHWMQTFKILNIKFQNVFYFNVKPYIIQELEIDYPKIFSDTFHIQNEKYKHVFGYLK